MLCPIIIGLILLSHLLSSSATVMSSWTFAVAILACLAAEPVDSFVTRRAQLVHNVPQRQYMTKGDGSFYDSPKDLDTEKLSVLVARQRLEDSHTKQIIRRKPLKLDYKTSRRWIQKNWNIKSKAEFYDLVANGNLRTPYISKRPEEYYGARGEWISWDHYLLTTDEDDEKNGTDEQQVTRWG